MDKKEINNKYTLIIKITITNIACQVGPKVKQRLPRTCILHLIYIYTVDSRYLEFDGTMEKI